MYEIAIRAEFNDRLPEAVSIAVGPGLYVLTLHVLLVGEEKNPS